MSHPLLSRLMVLASEMRKLSCDFNGNFVAGDEGHSTWEAYGKLDAWASP
jgi:hypothetical protein